MVDLDELEREWELHGHTAIVDMEPIIAELRAARAVVAAAKELNERREKNYYFEWNTLEDRCSEYDRATKGDG